MPSYAFRTLHRQIAADILTPVGIYLRLRDHYPNSLLLESSDYHSRENSYTYICCAPLAGAIVDGGQVRYYAPGQADVRETAGPDLPERLQAFVGQFSASDLALPFSTAGFFGYMSYEAVQYFEAIRLQAPLPEGKAIPTLQYHFYRFVLVFDHFKNALHLFEHLPPGEPAGQLDALEALVRHRDIAQYAFRREGAEKTNLTDQAFMDLVRAGKMHCQRGDVFQIVLSRAFRQAFRGDDFNVYRALRMVNPSPYLFYFDYGDFRILGSSPEAQLTVRARVASIHPIAGTYRRTGNDERDRQLAAELAADPKEQAEHVMLVDLARNDLSRHAKQVRVERFSEVQYFSHVIHLVSKVTGQLNGSGPLRIAADTFPAGTLSGAPKYKAMQLIDRYENEGRSFYGGAIGFFDLNGNFNHAIIIRSFLSKDNHLLSQAGAGIVAASDEASELQEVNNKLAALKKALDLAESL